MTGRLHIVCFLICYNWKSTHVHFFVQRFLTLGIRVFTERQQINLTICAKCVLNMMIMVYYDIIGELVRHKVSCQNLSWALGSSWDARQICEGVLPRTLLRAQLGAMELASQAERLAPQTDEQKNWADLGVLHKKSVPSEQTHRNIY